MSQDERSDIIHECIPDLVKQLTGFDDDDPNTQQCVSFAWNIIKSHRNLSTNSHEVRRKIEGIQERFRVENLPEYAEYLGRLCDDVVKDPLCLRHYEVDVHWSLLHFLFALAYNPIGALKRNKHNIEIIPAISEDMLQKQKEKIFWETVLKEDFIPAINYSSSESELSDWSDSESDSQMGQMGQMGLLVPSTTVGLISDDDDYYYDDDYDDDMISMRSLVPVSSYVSEIGPPEKIMPFRLFNNECIEERLEEKIQHSWWNSDEGGTLNDEVESLHRFANFSRLYARFLTETSNNLIRFQEPKTLLEQYVLREILWMFRKPGSCGVFFVDDNSGELKMMPNVTIPSCSVNSFQSFVQDQILPYIKMMNVLMQFHKDVYNCADRMPPRTLECYASNLKLLLTPVWNAILKFESRLTNPKETEINTLLSMLDFFKDSFLHLASLYDLHKKVVMDWRQHAAHVASAFLLSATMNCYQLESDTSRANLFMSLLLASLKTFCEIIEIWWIDGRLDDWREEYIVERIGEHDQSVGVREYRKNKARCFFVASYVSKIIEEDTLFLLMREHSLEAGRTLNLLYEINRIGDLRNNFDSIGEKFYNTFVEDFLAQVTHLQADVPKQNQEEDSAKGDAFTDDSDFFNETPTTATKTQEKFEKSELESLSTNDCYLLLAFQLNMTQEEEASAQSCTDMENKQINARYIYEKLQRSKFSLPLDELLLSVLYRLLKRRIALADDFVLQLYRHEFMVLKHLQNIRKVLLLEASDIMHHFYSKLFQQIESGAKWANPSLLTMQFDDILSSKFPDMSSLFSIEIASAHRCRSRKVIDVVEELSINYSISRELSQIITQEDIKSYNKVFCFLLKVKWGITTLEKLKFPGSHKRRIPYARFEMIDLIMRRLEQLRFWMIYAIQSIHFHLMTHVLQAMGEQLDVKVENSKNVNDLITVHKSYLSTVCNHCFLEDDMKTMKIGVEQILSLVTIVRDEWQTCVKYIESNNPLAISLNDSSDSDADADFVENSQLDSMEYTYIYCHQYLANVLNDHVYLRKRTFLAGLRAAFNTSMPH